MKLILQDNNTGNVTVFVCGNDAHYLEVTKIFHDKDVGQVRIFLSCPKCGKTNICLTFDANEKLIMR